MAPLPHSSQVTKYSRQLHERWWISNVVLMMYKTGSAVQNPVVSICTPTFVWLYCESQMSTRPRHILPRALTNGNRSRVARPAHAFPPAEIAFKNVLKELFLFCPENLGKRKNWLPGGDMQRFQLNHFCFVFWGRLWYHSLEWLRDANIYFSLASWILLSFTLFSMLM